jgi:hypothetical protein
MVSLQAAGAFGTPSSTFLPDGILFPIVNLLSMQYETNLVPDQPNDSKGLADRSS